MIIHSCIERSLTITYDAIITSYEHESKHEGNPLNLNLLFQYGIFSDLFDNNQLSHKL